jgi:4-diphosphocytidyl-2-C-methyl-D-erythritol kinase
MTVTVRSFAKINLGLRIGAPRPDGFHELLTVYQTIGLHDVIRITTSRGSGITITCADPRVPRDESNTCFRIVEKALQALRTKAKVVIDIDKRLPVQGGLGGASANAVATLLGLERALRKSLSAAEKLRIAAEVGSDLPLFLVGGAVLGVGRGEQVYPLSDFPAIPLVVVTPEVGVSTPKAFADWDHSQGLKPFSQSDRNAALKRRSSTGVGRDLVLHEGSLELEETPPELPSNWMWKSGPSELALSLPKGPRKTSTFNPGFSPSASEPETAAGLNCGSSSAKLTESPTSDRMNELGRALSAWLSEPFSGAPFRRGRAENPLLALVRAGIKNDFEQVVFPDYPELSEGKRALLRAGANYASLSGSGSTLYGLFDSRTAAVSAVARLRKQGWMAQASSTLTRRAYWKRVVAG